MSGGNSAAAAAASAAHLMQFNPLYMYQLQMAQHLGKKSCESMKSVRNFCENKKLTKF